MRLGGHAQPVAQHQLRRRGFNKAAITAVGGAGIQRAADINLVVAHVAHQKDAAIPFEERSIDTICYADLC